jgi:hypothetical protein
MFRVKLQETIPIYFSILILCVLFLGIRAGLKLGLSSVGHYPL